MSEPLNATFFTLRHRDRAVLAPATLVLIAILSGFLGLYVLLNWGLFSHLGEIIQAGGAPLSEQDTGRLVAGMFGLFGTSLLLIVPIYLVIAAYEAACLRWMIRGEAPGLFGLTLDHDTWRVYGIYWCWFIGISVIGMIVSMIAMPFMFMSMGDLMTDPSPDPYEMMRWQFSVQVPVMLLQYVPMIFFGVRFGPAAATSIVRRRFSVFEAWTVTKGRFWPLLGSFLLLWVIFGVGYLVVTGGGYAILFGDILRAVFADWPNVSFERHSELFERLFNVRTFGIVVAIYVANGIIALAYCVMSFGVNARAALLALEEGKISAEPPAA